MTLIDRYAKTLQLSLLAVLCACSGGLERADDVAPADALDRASVLSASCTTTDAGPEQAADAGSDASATPLSTKPGERCSPSGEGDLPWAPCDKTRGLVCTPPERAQLDAPDSCQCPEGKTFSEGSCGAP
jgi:hypothetical protein